MGPFKGSEPWAPVLKVVLESCYNGLCKDSELGAHTEGP